MSGLLELELFATQRFVRLMIGSSLCAVYSLGSGSLVWLDLRRAVSSAARMRFCSTFIRLLQDA